MCEVRCSAVTEDCPNGLTCSNGLCGLPSEACPMPSDGSVDGPGSGGDAADSDSGVPAPGWRQVSAGLQHACAIADDGTMWCWGRNDAGTLGDMTTMRRAGAVQVGVATDWEQLDAGSGAHTCGIQTGGVLSCWGANYYAQIGDNSPGVLNRTSPAQVAAVTTGSAWTQVAAGGIFTCALRDDASLYCWGTNTGGQLGQGGAGGSSAVPIRVGMEFDWQSISAGDYHACGIRGAGGSGDLYCWGYNAQGAVGDGSVMERHAPTPIAAGTTWTSVNAGSLHTCGFDDGGQLYCWGANGAGATGIPGGMNQLMPMAVGSPGTWSAVEPGGVHTCALRGDDAVDCWGDNFAGQLGQGANMGGTHIPQFLLGLPPALEIASGGRHGCARLMNGEIRCWGDNGEGQVGDGTIANKRSPVAVGDPLLDWDHIDTGVDHTCGVTETNDLYCWGRNDHGQLGDGTSQSRYTPGLVRDDLDWAEVVAGNRHTCAREVAGQLWCWGGNDTAQTGLGGGTGDYPNPMQVGGNVYTRLSTGTDTSCAIDGSGTRWCWGRNAEAQIGNGDMMTALMPEAVDSPWVRVGNGVFFGCGIHGPGASAGRLSCWGANVMGPTELIPVFVGTDADWTEIWPAAQHVCGLRGGLAFCWGMNESGQLGTGGFANATTPAPVVGGALDWIDIDTGGQHSCGLRSGGGGQVFCWGANVYGQLGDGGITSRSSPGTAIVGGPYREMSAGNSRSCAIGTDGSLWCWGENLHGALGDGTGLRTPTVVVRQP